MSTGWKSTPRFGKELGVVDLFAKYDLNSFGIMGPATEFRLSCWSSEDKSQRTLYVRGLKDPSKAFYAKNVLDLSSVTCSMSSDFKVAKKGKVRQALLAQSVNVLRSCSTVYKY